MVFDQHSKMQFSPLRARQSSSHFPLGSIHCYTNKSRLIVWFLASRSLSPSSRLFLEAHLRLKAIAVSQTND
jgi:hypothetical protein